MKDEKYRDKTLPLPPLYLGLVRFFVGMAMVMFCAFQVISSIEASPNRNQRLYIWQIIPAVFSSPLIRQQVISGGAYFLSVVFLGIGLSSRATIFTWPIATGLLLLQGHRLAGWVPLVIAVIVKITEVLWMKRTRG